MRGVDFATDELRDALRDLEDTGLDRDAPTVAVAEGLLMYLRPEAVAALWQDVRAHCRARVDVVASAVACGDDEVGRGSSRDRSGQNMLNTGLAVSINKLTHKYNIIIQR